MADQKMISCWTSAMLLLVILALASATSGHDSLAEDQLYQPHCRSALGMHSGEIPDSAITASSSYDVKSVGPHNSRIRMDTRGGAWCPNSTINREVHEYLQIDLGDVKVISLVETQGRFGNGQGQEYAPNFKLEYQRVEGGAWIHYHERREGEILQGNMNTYTPRMTELRPPIIARKIRFVPYSNHPRTVCMRVEMYGCPWKDGVMSYNMRQGERRGQEVDLYDFSYDGKVENDYLSEGLGQLIDWEEGDYNFRLDPQGTGRKGYEWVGWKNDSLSPAPPVDIIFGFDQIRNFTSMRIHCNNYFSKDVRVFRLAKIYFSVGGEHFVKEPILFEYMRDTLIEFARYVIIPLPHMIGQYVKVQLHFDARWIMISEVEFKSEPAFGAFTQELPPPPTPPGERRDGNIGADDMGPNSDMDQAGRMNPSDGDQGLSPRGPGVEEIEVGIGQDTDDVAAGTTDKSAPPDLTEAKPKGGLDDTYIGIIIGALGALLILLAIIIIFVIRRHRRNKYSGSSPIKSMFGVDHVNFNLNDLTPGVTANGKTPKVNNGNMYNSVATSEVDNTEKEPLHKVNGLNGDVYREPCDSIQNRKLPELPACTPCSTDTATSREYATPDMKYSPLVVNLPPNPVFRAPGDSDDSAAPPPPPLPHPRAVCAASDMVNIQGLSGNSLYAVPNPDLLWKEDFSIIEFPRENLNFVEKLGEGQFGEVHLCQAIRMTDFLGDDFLVNRTGTPSSMMVAVKTLRRDACDQARLDFHKEAKIMSQLKDPNIVRVLGVCTQEEPLAVVVEYMKYGDLNQFLLHHIPESTIPRNTHQRPLSYGCLIYMATQIASGMKYLETMNMVHRDLATRNCLVGSLFNIKISDFGMSRSLYSSDYYRIEGKAVLPIRWMAWESVLLGKFSCKSDVWSFAITLWEVLTFARERPFNELPDEQVIENCGHYYRNDGQEHYLPQPSNCPKEIFDLMCECWNRDEMQRPTFREIHMFLQRKNMGYDPLDEENLNSLPVV